MRKGHSTSSAVSLWLPSKDSWLITSLGIPLSELELDPKQTEGQRLSSDKNPSQARGAPVLHKPNSIIFCRRRMLYARVALNAQAHVRFGLKHTRTCALFVR